MDNLNIGFFTLHENNDSLVGGLLVTNDIGIPLEFKCTQSIKPTSIQKTLYGDKMKSHIAVGLCGLPLLEATANKPHIICLNQGFALDLRFKVGVPTVYLSRAGDAINLASDQNREVLRHRIDNSEGIYLPLVLQVNPKFLKDAEDSMTMLNTLFDRFDLLEPFERVSKSIEILAKMDQKFA